MKATHAAMRNIAIIAHVDHGKTSLVDSLFKQCGVFRQDQDVQERIMDSMELERERGITIAAKNCAIQYNGVKINIIDTPGHADFGGEVERALSMADGAILLVDASEGPLPQTRFVLGKALALDLALVVIINKIDRQDARPLEVLDEVSDLLIDLDASEHQLSFPVLFAVGRDGIAKKALDGPDENLDVLIDTILEAIPSPEGDVNGPFQLLVSDLGYSDYLGRLAIGKVYAGSARANDNLVCIDANGANHALKLVKIQTFSGHSMVDAAFARQGDIVVLAGIDSVHIGDTICTRDNPRPLTRITVDEPTVSMKFMKNTSPLSGREGRFVQSSKLFERLRKETLQNVSMSLQQGQEQETFIVQGRGEFQMVILIESMRREGYEFSVGRPEVIFKKVDGKKLEPIEHLYVDCEDTYVGAVTEKLSRRKGHLLTMINHETGRVRMEFSVPSRALIGYRDEFLTDTRGTGILNAYFSGYEPYRGDFAGRHTGSLVSDRAGNAVPYALFNLEPRGNLFVVPGEPVYEGMVIGEHNKNNDLNVNPCRTKKLSNMRASGKDDAVVLTPILPITLERAVQFIRRDELIEVTPASIRIRKAVLPAQERKMAAKIT
ncbi:MAG: translational GTPase TypA [Spirochaetales bacterium]|nr:translational GTPase TypA [Spirochaetales bacterium]